MNRFLENQLSHITEFCHCTNSTITSKQPISNKQYLFNRVHRNVQKFFIALFSGELCPSQRPIRWDKRHHKHNSTSDNTNDKHTSTNQSSNCKFCCCWIRRRKLIDFKKSPLFWARVWFEDWDPDNYLRYLKSFRCNRSKDISSSISKCN